MRWYVNCGCLVVFVSIFCLLGFAAAGEDAPADKEALRYDGKPFEDWRTYLRTELKAERRVDAIRALAEFGIRGHAQSSATAIVDAVKDYGEDAYGGDEKDPTPDQKLIRTAAEGIVKIGPAGFEIVLRNAKNANVRRFAEMVYKHPFKDKRVNVLSASAVRSLLGYVQGDDIEIRKFAGELLGEAIRDYPPSKDNVLSVLRAEKDTSGLVRSLIELLLDERRSTVYLEYVIETFGSRGKAAAPALVKAQLRGYAIDNSTFKAIGVEAKELIPDITEGLKSQKVGVRTRAAQWLTEMGDAAKPAVPALLQGLNEGLKKMADADSSRSARGLAVYYPSEPSDDEEKAWLAELGALQRMGAVTRKLIPSLVRVVADRNRTEGCRIAVAKALGEMGADARDALPALREAAKEMEAEVRAGRADPALRQAAMAAIAKIEGKQQK